METTKPVTPPAAWLERSAIKWEPVNRKKLSVNKGWSIVSDSEITHDAQSGKRLLAKKLDARISPIPHRTYAEPFVGMGGVFFRRTSKPKAEIINDLNEEVINLFRILREHYSIDPKSRQGFEDKLMDHKIKLC